MDIELTKFIWWHHDMEKLSASIMGESKSPVHSTHKGSIMRTCMFPLLLGFLRYWTKRRVAVDMIPHDAHIIVMNFPVGYIYIYICFNMLNFEYAITSFNLTCSNVLWLIVTIIQSLKRCSLDTLIRCIMKLYFISYANLSWTICGFWYWYLYHVVRSIQRMGV